MKTIKHERWIAVVNKNDYVLDEKQAQVLTEAINSGSRGIIQFDGFIIPISFLQEFYLDRRWEENQYSQEDLEALGGSTQSQTSLPRREITEEEKRLIEEQRQLLIEKSKMIARGYDFDHIKQLHPHKVMSPEEEKKRKELLLEQAKQLKEQGL